MTGADRVSARRTVFGAVELRADQIRDDVLDALGRAALRSPAEVLSLLVELGQALADLDDDHSPRLVRPVDLAAIRDDLLTLADYGHATTALDHGTAARLTSELAAAGSRAGERAVA